MFHEKTKHSKRDMHYVREQVAEGFLTTAHVSSNQQLVHVLTKAFPFSQHHSICSKLCLVTQIQLEGNV